ncbi:hypothetical protein A9Q81_21040 [Gammaproteobacteria bacterium 42_54_T18]|nr:hypothetical protein A9Q81_21040 [Gammaproteobacteria bacterium 42_54_T18]
MNDIIDKLSSYNLFNYLLPGVVFVFLAEAFTGITISHDEVVVMAFIYYFIGLVISRIGSVCIEPILKKITEHAPYEDYVKASKADETIPTFSEQNNMYRTIISMLFCLMLMFFYDSHLSKITTVPGSIQYIVVGMLLVLFVLSYRKQTMYIRKRIQSNCDNSQA